jgi:hypothetical protein
MKKIIEYFMSAFDTHSKGASARKVSAFSIMLCIVVAHAAWIKKCFMENDFSLLTTVLTIDYAFVGGLLGLTTYEKIKMKDNEKPSETTTTT